MADIYTDVGEDITADLLDGTASAPPWTAAWGTGAGTAGKGDTTLFTESAESRVVSVATQPISNQNQFVSTITSGGAQTITNAGIFSAQTSGTMLLKSDFAGIALTGGDKIEFTFKLTWS
jgi:hypothetical protein